MAAPHTSDPWMARMVADPAERQKEFRRACRTESASSLAAAGFACLAIWGFTSGDRSIGGIPVQAIAGISVLCFGSTMAIAAGGGIRKRLIALLGELEAHRS